MVALPLERIGTDGDDAPIANADVADGFEPGFGVDHPAASDDQITLLR
jgi:hypothetical protein